MIRPILRGRDIKRYKAEWAGLYVLNIHNGVKEKNIPQIDINNYPAIKTHLDQFWDKISKRDDKGVTPYNLRNCAYLDDFNKQKIVWGDLARTGNVFALDLYQFFFNNTGYMLVLKEDDLCLLTYILHFLNSTTILFYHDITSSKLDVNGWRWFREFVE